MEKQVYEQRINKAFLATLPADVSAKLAEVSKRYGRKIVTVYEYSKFTLQSGEGETYHVFYGGKSTSVSMVRNDSVGAGGVCYDINGKAEMPAGTWIVELSDYIMGKRCISLIHVMGQAPAQPEIEQAPVAQIEAQEHSLMCMCDECLDRFVTSRIK
jgi:hypothetical protein